MAKNIVIFADGTWNRKDHGAVTNVARLHEMAVNGKVRSGRRIGRGYNEQRTFYDPGVGSGSLKYTGGIGGLGISRNIRECYRFLMAHCRPEEDDRVFLFGFSRGAFTVRSLAGMLGKVGLLKLECASESRVKKAYKCYRQHAEYPHQAEEFRRQYCWNCDPYFIGVWDTVGALGIPVNWLNRWNPFPHRFHDHSLGAGVKFAYHALAIDDLRETFHPAMWEEPSAEEKNRRGGQVVEQVWFAGMHADVGGGYLETSLSDIPLQWMADKAHAAGLFLRPDYESILTPSAEGMMHDSRLGAKRIFRKKMRKISTGGTAMVHRSVEKRRERSKNWERSYNPRNLPETEKIQWVPPEPKSKKRGPKPRAKRPEGAKTKASPRRS